MKTKTKRGKAIIGLAVVAIMVASVMTAMIGSTGAYSNSGPYNNIKVPYTATQQVIIGQDLYFENSTGKVTISRVKDNSEEWSIMSDSSQHLTVSADESQWTKDGTFYVNWDDTAKTWDSRLSISSPSMPLKLKVGTKTVSSIAVGSPLTVDISGTNLDDMDVVDLVIEGPNGKIEYDAINDQDFTDITVENLTANFGAANLVTKGWDIGVYTFTVETVSENACGLDATSATKELRMLKGTIAIDADTTNTVELKTVKITVTGVANDTIEVTAEPCSDAVFKKGIDDTPRTFTKENCSFEQKIKAAGVMKYAIQFEDTGSFTIKAEVIVSPGGVRDGDYDTVDIAVSEKQVEFDLPSTVVIGDRITIKGTSASGTYVSVYVEDTLYPQLKALVIDDGEFSKEVSTTEIGMNVPGSVRLKAWVDITPAPATPPTTTADGEDAILLGTPDLTAELSAPTVAIGDSFHVTGVAAGSTSVTIMTVPPKGGGGKSLISSGKGIDILTASVSTTDNTFDRKISVQDEAASGYYDIYVLSPGMDGVWDATNNTNLIGAINERYNIQDITDPKYAGTKSQDGIYSILVDLTTTAGSDDLIWVAQIKAEEPRVTLDPIAAVGVGQPLVVSGLCNRADGYTIVVTATGALGTYLPPQTVKVYNGTFNATVDTTDAVRGPYLVKADDGDGHTDEATVTIGGPAPTPTQLPETPTPIPSQLPETPTPIPSQLPATPTPTPEPPGFEAIFAIAGLLAVAYLVIRRRK